jgi:RNA polymerase sigma-70 factor (ECF subfamily)
VSEIIASGDYIDVGTDPPDREELYRAAVRDFGRALDRLAAGYESDPDKRRDLRQEIHLQLWKSFGAFDGRCSVKTWTFRVAHNTAVTYSIRERRRTAGLVSLEDVELPSSSRPAHETDRRRALEQLSEMILCLKPLDRQIILCYLEEMDAASIAAVTGLSSANVATKIHRIKSILARRFVEEQHHV